MRHSTDALQRYLGCRTRLRVVIHRCSHWVMCIILSFVAIPSRVATALSLEYRRCGEHGFNPFQSSYCFVSIARCRHDSGEARMSQEKIYTMTNTFTETREPHRASAAELS